MGTRLQGEALDVVFRQARTFRVWLDKPATDDVPARILFLRTPESKERLLAPGNVPNTMTAPVTAIIAQDMRFYETLPKLAPHNPKARTTLIS